VVLGLISALLVTLLGQVRIFYAMARDGLLPKMFVVVHPRWGTPHIGTLLAFAIVCLGVIVLRRRRPDLLRPFRVPGYPWVPLAGIAVCLALMASLPRDTWVRLVVWLVLGLVVYGTYGVKHSRLR
jgi:basic amino acid/polyamine antiporter, APA family